MNAEKLAPRLNAELPDTMVLDKEDISEEFIRFYHKDDENRELLIGYVEGSVKPWGVTINTNQLNKGGSIAFFHEWDDLVIWLRPIANRYFN